MTVKGSIDEIRFRNDDNGYTILTLDCEGEPVICVGTFPPVAEGEYLSLTGDFVMHPKFGRQFKASGVARSQPDTLDGLVRYLGSGLIKGIGPKTALAIVETFGKDTLKVIEYTPQFLTRVRGISRAKAEEIRQAYGEIKQMQDAVMYLTERGIGLGTSLKIYKKYGDKTVPLVSSNPYRLIEDVDGIGFITADRIAKATGIAEDSDFRVRAGIIYVLKDSGEKNGNTYLPREELTAETQRTLGLSDEGLVAKNIDALRLEQKIKQLAFDDGIMLTGTYHTEKGAATKLVKLIEDAGAARYDVSGEIAEFEELNRITFAEGQKRAIELAASSGAAVITGGPGTGKTTVIKCVLSILDKLRLKAILMAPTGRAAKRLSESTEREASTIHRALMMDAGEGAYRAAGEMLPVDVVIIDEFSMVDVFLFNTLLGRLAPGTHLIMVGDKDQLPSVGAGNVLADILASSLVPTVYLDQIYRQAGESLIVTNAHAINRGEMPQLKSRDGDFFYYKSREPADMADTIVGLVGSRLPNYLGVEPYRIQVLCPMKNGVAGVHNLNKRLQDAVNPARGQAELSYEDTVFRTGDKVMHIANNYNLEWRREFGYSSVKGSGVFNGDLGVITDITKAGEIEVLYEDVRRALYTADIRSQLILAYAITVHKSQGSEFDAVIIPVAGGNSMIMTRNLLYTAITRAKKLAVIIGEEYNIKRMVDNNYIAKRYSALQNFISDAQKEIGLLYGEDTNGKVQ